MQPLDRLAAALAASRRHVLERIVRWMEAEGASHLDNLCVAAPADRGARPAPAAAWQRDRLAESEKAITRAVAEDAGVSRDSALPPTPTPAPSSPSSPRSARVSPTASSRPTPAELEAGAGAAARGARRAAGPRGTLVAFPARAAHRRLGHGQVGPGGGARGQRPARRRPRPTGVLRVGRGRQRDAPSSRAATGSGASKRVAELLKRDAGELFVSGCAWNMGRLARRFDVVVLLAAPRHVLAARLAGRPAAPAAAGPRTRPAPSRSSTRSSRCCAGSPTTSSTRPFAGRRQRQRRCSRSSARCTRARTMPAPSRAAGRARTAETRPGRQVARRWARPLSRARTRWRHRRCRYEASPSRCAPSPTTSPRAAAVAAGRMSGAVAPAAQRWAKAGSTGATGRFR